MRSRQLVCNQLLFAAAVAWGACGGSGPPAASPSREPLVTLLAPPEPHTDTDTCTATDLACGYNHCCVLASNGDVWCWGASYSGQIGAGDDVSHRIGSLDFVRVPTRVHLQKPARLLAAGGDHACAATRDGQVYCWGHNLFGQVGIPRSLGELVPEPVRVEGLASGLEVRALSVGGDTSCALDDAGGVWCWGSNVYGELGRKDPPSSPLPLEVPDLPPARSISVGDNGVCALGVDSRVYCWGAELPGPTIETVRPIAGLDGSVQVAVGGFHTCAVREGGELWCWGANVAGQLGDGTTVSSPSGVAPSLAGPVRAVYAGSGATAAVTRDRLYAWGQRGCRISHALAQAVPGNRRASPVPCDPPIEVTPQPVALTSIPVSVSAGANHMCALLEGGSVMCWGSNYFGQLGDGTIQDHLVLRQVVWPEGFAQCRGQVSPPRCRH